MGLIGEEEAIRKLQAEVERLRRELAEARAEVERLGEFVGPATDRVCRALAEREAWERRFVEACERERESGAGASR